MQTNIRKIRTFVDVIFIECKTTKPRNHKIYTTFSLMVIANERSEIGV